MLGDTRKFFRDCKCIFTVRVLYASAMFSDTSYVQYAYVIPEANVYMTVSLMMMVNTEIAEDDDFHVM